MKGEKIIMDAVKMTKKDYLNAIISYLNGEEVDVPVEDMVGFCQKEVDTLAARAENAKERAAAKRAEGDELQVAVLNALTDEPATRQEIFERIDIADTSVAKVGYRLTTLVNLGQAVKSEVTAEGEDGKTHKYAAYALA